ncbi:MAG TPA: type II secretion system F family protein [Gemmataceae bacterium]|jgi:tight adherence protein C
MNEWLIVSLIFVAVSGTLFVLLQRSSARRQRLEERLRSGKVTEIAENPELILGELTPAIAEQVPLTEKGRTDLHRVLTDAGFYRPTAVMEYVALRTVLLLVPLVGAAVFALFVEPARIPVVALVGLILALLGYSFPRIFLDYLARTRTRQIERGLPVALDLITLGLSAGLTILASLRRVAIELKKAYPILAYELEIVQQQAELRSLEHALQQLSDRVRVPEIRNLALILVHSERLGTDIGTTLLEFATAYRTTLKQRAEAQANKASFWMTFPTVLCLWISAAIILVGPMYYEFWNRRTQAQDLLKGRMDRLNQGKVKAKQGTAKAPATGGGP